MDVAFEASFARDLKKIRSKTIRDSVQDVIEQVRSADSLQNIRGLSKLEGYTSYYRIRLKDYRLGIEVEGNQVIFVRILHRKDIYRYFP